MRQLRSWPAFAASADRIASTSTSLIGAGVYDSWKYLALVSADDLPLFSALAKPRPAAAPGPGAALTEALAAVVPDALSPREALETLYRLKALIPDKG